jgi:hypothetical protein
MGIAKEKTEKKNLERQRESLEQRRRRVKPSFWTSMELDMGD